MLGASDWEYIVPYQENLVAALADLRHRVFANGDFVSPAELGLPTPASVEDLLNEQYWEFMGSHGTHSILDIVQVVESNDYSEEYGSVRPLTEDEYIELFGSLTPSNADFEELSNSERLHDYVSGGRGTGRVAVLWTSGKPDALAFWGYSGD